MIRGLRKHSHFIDTVQEHTRSKISLCQSLTLKELEVSELQVGGGGMTFARMPNIGGVRFLSLER